jgi:hypothetical protein
MSVNRFFASMTAVAECFPGVLASMTAVAEYFSGVFASATALILTNNHKKSRMTFHVSKKMTAFARYGFHFREIFAVFAGNSLSVPSMLRTE